MSEFERWLVEQRLQSEAMRANMIPQTPKLDLRGDVLVPTFQALAIGIVGAISTGGVIGLLSSDLIVGLTWGAGLGFAAFGTAEVSFLLEHRMVYTGGIRLAWAKFAASQGPKQAPKEPLPRFIPVFGRRLLTAKAPDEPDGERRGFLARLADRMREKIEEHDTRAVSHQRAELESFEQSAPGQAPELEAPAWVVDMYDILTATWQSGDLTRRNFERLFEGGTALWIRYVNGDPSKPGRRGRSVFQNWGIIERKDGRGAWRYCQPLDVIFGLDPELAAYAKAKVEGHSPSERQSTNRNNGGPPNQTEPTHQTDHQSQGVSHGR